MTSLFNFQRNEAVGGRTIWPSTQNDTLYFGISPVPTMVLPSIFIVYTGSAAYVDKDRPAPKMHAASRHQDVRIDDLKSKRKNMEHGETGAIIHGSDNLNIMCLIV
jgi:hypothetical protein